MNITRGKLGWLMTGLAFACGVYAVLHSGCTAPPAEQTDEPASELAVTEAACEPIDTGSGGFEIGLRAVSAEGRQLEYTRRVIMTPGRDAGFQMETEVTADGQLVMSIVAMADANGAEVEIVYGPLVPGLSTAKAVVQGGMLTGSVNGRDLLPMSVNGDFDPAALSLQDGEAPPDPGMDADLEAAMTDLFSAASTTADGCPTTIGGGSASAATARLLENSGHYSETGLYDNADCAECWGVCAVEAVGCAAGVAGGCALSFFGYVACVVAGEIGCAVDEGFCIDDCYDEGEGCCPVACGDVTCCLEGESCLNDEYGYCCGPGEKPCYEKYCCEGTESCIFDSVINEGGCCPVEDICGGMVRTCCEPTDTCIPEHHLCCAAGHPPCVDKCCDSGQQCINTSECCDVENICNNRCCEDDELCHAGVCCHPNNVCGNVCCDELDSGCIPELSLCCGFDQDVCGTACCPIGESCVGGTTCCPDARICGDLCCPEGNGCDTQTEQCAPCPNPTDTPCVEGGCCPAGKVCSGVEGICCDPGKICCNASCTEGCKYPYECLY